MLLLTVQVCAKRVSQIEVAPNVLAVTLKRFGVGRYGKINKKVAYDEQLDLQPFMVGGLDIIC